MSRGARGADLQERDSFTAEIAVSLEEFPVSLITAGRIDQTQRILELALGSRSDESHCAGESANRKVVQAGRHSPCARVVAQLDELRQGAAKLFEHLGAVLCLGWAEDHCRNPVPRISPSFN